MTDELVPFKEIYQQKTHEVKQLPLLPGHTTVINATKHSGGASLTLECLIGAIKSSSNKNFLYYNVESPTILARSYLAKFGGGMDTFTTSESEWNSSVLAFLGCNNLYFSSDITCIPLVGLLGNNALNVSMPTIDYYFLNNVSPEDLRELQKTNPLAVFVVDAVIEEGHGIVNFSSYCHSE